MLRIEHNCDKQWTLMEALIDLRQVCAFIAVAESGSFTQASRRLHLSQPAVSRAVAALEQEIGARLLERSGRQVSLTSAGQTLLSRGRRLLAETVLLREELQASEHLGTGSLRLAADPSACDDLLPAVLREFKESFPASTWAITPVSAIPALELIRGKSVEVALVTRPLRLPASVRFERLFEEELVFAVNPSHPWAAGRKAPPRDIERYAFLLPLKESETYQLVDRYFARQGLRLRTLAELGSVEAIRAMTAYGLGIGILPRWAIPRTVEDGKVVAVPLGRSPLRRSWGLLSLKGKRPGLAERAFLELCRSIIPQLIRDRAENASPAHPACS
ncbi:MAG: LysR family transcriptional regulator [Methylacidiphilaceae bacterium]|nr:LysR family transcriptional regulator [Candidatus Methylacidiphilaceae bacterium]